MELKRRAQGRWYSILAHVGVDPSYLINHKGPCPGCGGKDRFRWDDKEGHGTFFCGGGGNPLAGDGFGLIKHIYGCDFPEAARMVEDALGGKQLANIPRRVAPASTLPTLAIARRIWMKAKSDDNLVAAHPYAKLKGIDRAYGAGRTVVSGSVVGQESDCLVLPLRSLEGQFKGVEVIGMPAWDEVRKKHATPKQTFGSKGVLMLGNTLDKSLPVFLVEGWCDAVSVWRQKGDVVVLAVFGDRKRQEHFAETLDKHNPNRDYILLRDAL